MKITAKTVSPHFTKSPLGKKKVDDTSDSRPQKQMVWTPHPQVIKDLMSSWIWTKDGAKVPILDQQNESFMSV